MDPPPVVRHPLGKVKKTKQAKLANPQLFDDTSTGQPQYYGQPPPAYGYGGVPPGSYYPSDMQGIPGQQLLSDPMAAMAMSYGKDLAGHGKEIVNKNLEKWISISKLKYYFAVDTTYVGKKLALLFFPFSHTDWSVKYNQDQPVAPRYEVNAPDLYIPVMAFVTYIVITGLVLGTQNRFSPEQLGLHASSALGWLILEIVVILLTLYIMNITSDMKALDLIAFCGYKYVGMISSLLAGLVFKSFGYYCLLLYCSVSLSFFLVRTLRVLILPESGSDHFSRGSKRRLYLLLFIAGLQPLMMYWLTYHLSHFSSITKPTDTGNKS